MALDSQQKLEKLFKEHHQVLSNLAYNIVRDREIAKDILQEVFIKLWQNRDRITFGDQILHYLTKATAHTSLNHLRSSRKLTSLESTDLSLMHSSPDQNDYSYVEFEQKVRAAIDNLPPKCRAIYLLSRHEGMKYQEIAEALNLSVKTIENQMGIALEKLRTDLKAYLPPLFVLILLLLGFSLIFF